MGGEDTWKDILGGMLFWDSDWSKDPESWVSTIGVTSMVSNLASFACEEGPNESKV